MVNQNYYTYPEKFIHQHMPRVIQNQKLIKSLGCNSHWLVKASISESIYALSSSLNDIESNPKAQIRMEDLTGNKSLLYSFICENFDGISLNQIDNSLIKISPNNHINTHLRSSSQFNFPDISTQCDFNLNNTNEWHSTWIDLIKSQLTKYESTIFKLYPNDPILDFLAL